MKIIKTCVALLLTASLFATTGCKKGEKGDPGPAGTNGTNGVDGNVNVVAGKATLFPANWGWNATSKVSYCRITYAPITKDIVDKGTVSVFMNPEANSEQWIAIPFTFWGNPSVTYGYGYDLGAVEIIAARTDQQPLNPSIIVKIVVISAAQKKAHPNTNWKDYNQVMRVLEQEKAVNL